MKNCFDLDVCFKNYPVQPYDWDSVSTLINMKAFRVSTHLLKEVLEYDGKILNYNSKFMLLSDGKEAAVLKLDREGQIVKRSFLEYEKSLEVCEFIYNLKESKIDFFKEKKVEYPECKSVEEEVRDYIVGTIERVRDKDFEKYLYYLYCDEVANYSRDKLFFSIEHAPLEVNMRLYKFLIES